MSDEYLTQTALSRRWKVSPRTLERWRWSGDGSRFIKIGGSVRYRLEDVLAYEAGRLSDNPTAAQPR